MSLNTVTLKWDLTDLIEAGLSATLSITPTAQLSDTTDHILIPPVARSVKFSGGTGQLAGIVANDNSSILPANTGYLISVTSAAGVTIVPQFQTQLLYSNGATQWLDALAVVPVVATGYQYTSLLARTSVQTSNYAASANQVVPVDTTSGSVTVTLPNAPAAGTLVSVKQVTQGGSNTVTIACAGSDVFNKSGGGTTGTLKLLSQGMLLHYNGSGIWTVLSDDLPLSQLDARYAPGISVFPSGDATGATDTAAINAVAQAGKAALLTAGTYYTTNLLIDTLGAIIGVGEATVLQAVSGTTGYMIALKTPASTCLVTIRGLMLVPDTGTLGGIQIDNTAYTSQTVGAQVFVDPNHTVADVQVAGANLGGDAFHFDNNARALRVSNCKANSVNGYGMYVGVGCTDSQFYGCTMASSSLHGWYVRGWNNMFTGCKAAFAGFNNATQTWGTAGIGFEITGKYNSFTGCSSQNSALHGFDLNGVLFSNGALSNTITGCEADGNNGGATTGVGFNVTGAQYCVVTGNTGGNSNAPVTSVASGSNGGVISTIASWSSPSAGVLDVASATAFPSSGTVTVAASGSATAVITYTGTAAGQLTGCAYVSGSAAGTVSTGGAVTLVSVLSQNQVWGVQVTGTCTGSYIVGNPVTGISGNVSYLGSTGAALSAPVGMFGDGSDGSVTLDGVATYSGMSLAGSTYTMSRDIQATLLTINSGVTLKPAGYRVFCQGAVSNAGTIDATGNAGLAAGTAGAHTTNGSFQGGLAGGAGNTGAGSSGTSSNGNGTGNAGAGGLGAGGAAGGAGTMAVTGTSWFRTPGAALAGVLNVLGNVTALTGGPGGGGGGGDGTNKGGGGGSGGGPILIFARAIINTGTISAPGGAGGTPATGNCGGGGGGAGGPVLLYTLIAWSNTGATNVAGGALGSGVGTGANGSAGSSGNVLNVVLQ